MASRIAGVAGVVLVFFTSAAVLVLEILAGRLVAPYVGVSLETYTGIIGTVLAGMAVGSWVGGWAADRFDPRRLLGPTLVASGVAALMAPVIIAALGPDVADADGGARGIVLLAVAAFVVPTGLLNAVTPMVAKLRLSSVAETGVVVGGLSAAGTAGALVGTFMTGFVLVAALPTRPIVVGLGLALVATGAALAIGGPRLPQVISLAVTAVALPISQTSPEPCQIETAYYCVSVERDLQRSTGRTLRLDNLRHSYVDLADATYLEFRYVRLFAATVDAVLPTGPVRALHIGGGGFTFPRYLHSTRPGSSNLVLELDPDVFAVAKKQLGLRVGEGLRVRTGDARRNVLDVANDSQDLVVGDAFGGLSVPWHLTTVEMVREIERVLRTGGLYVLNVIDAGPRDLVRAVMATLGDVFDHTLLLAPRGTVSGNHVLVASDAPLPNAIATSDGVPVAGAELARFTRGATVLRDDFAPASQLLTRG